MQGVGIIKKRIVSKFDQKFSLEKRNGKKIKSSPFKVSLEIHIFSF
jgi:hypothetical protein